MASEVATLYIKSADGSQNIYQDYSYKFRDSESLSACLSTNAPTVAYAALTIGGTAISGSISMGELYATYGVSGTLTLYDVTPIPAETITGFYLDGQEYVIGGSGGGEWGTITGTLSDQTDLNTALTAKANASDVLTKTNTTSFTPSADYHPATKKYVDDNAGAEYNAGEGISIGDVSINARKGPCPDGFHVPANSEWQGVKTIMDGLSLTTGDNWKVNLHMPFAGFRDYSTAVLNGQGSYCFYWSSSLNSAGSVYARRIFLASSYVIANDTGYRAYGIPVRCFKDSYETPTSSWTVVQGTLGSAGIFWNQSQGLISITDGTTGYTMMDKNLGATTVYNDGDTLSDANMGYMYQWGNNYGFPSTGSVSKTSSTQVDASGYGPSTVNGYYESDTFITGSTDWSSVSNDDLWGDTTGTITQENVISNTGVLSVNGQTGNVTIQTGGEQNLFIITEDIVTVSTSEDTGVAPYSTSYKYTNFDINANAGIEWKEGAIYTFVVDTEMEVASAYRNVRVRIGSGVYIPVMGTTAAAAGNSYFTKTSIRQYQYTTKYESGGALHVFTDSNTTYKSMTAAQATAGTSTTALTISPSILKGAIGTHATVKSGDNGISYTIKVSTTAPASGTANNVITFVTD